MNNKYENFTPRERVDAELLRRLLEEGGSPQSSVPAADAVPASARTQCCRRTAVQRTACPYSRPAEESAQAVPLAMVYSPEQEFSDLYEAEKGLCRGTIFMRLDKPLNEGCCREGRWK